MQASEYSSLASANGPDDCSFEIQFYTQQSPATFEALSIPRNNYIFPPQHNQFPVNTYDTGFYDGSALYYHQSSDNQQQQGQLQYHNEAQPVENQVLTGGPSDSAGKIAIPREISPEKIAKDRKKRSRGRPLLNETRQNRRREQMRLAQQLYRERKNTTLANLQKEADRLEQTNNEMRNTFMKLYNYATSNALFQEQSEFGHKMAEMSQVFIPLAKQNDEDEDKPIFRMNGGTDGNCEMNEQGSHCAEESLEL